jgi:hypothetical protein
MRNKSSQSAPNFGVRTIKKLAAASLLCFCLTAQAWGQSLSVSKDTVFTGSSGQDHELTDTISVAATGAWTVTVPDSVNWLTLDTVAGDGSNYTLTASDNRNITLSGSGNGRFTVRALSNSGGPEREGAFTIEAGGATKTITVMQDWNIVWVGGIKYGRRNPGKPSDPYIGVLHVHDTPGGGYWNTNPPAPTWVLDPDLYSGDIVIPDTVTYEGKAYIPETIESHAFYDCRGMTSISLPNSVKEFGEWAFGNCDQLTSFAFPESLTHIGNCAFSGCRGLIDITIPNSVTGIGFAVFTDCSGLTSVTLHNSLTSIGDEAFYKCGNLASITFPNSLTSIGNNAFRNCGNLTSVIIPNSVTNFGYNVFYECGNLASATLPGSITGLREHIFYKCGALETIEVGWDTPPNAVWNPGTFAEYSIFDGISSGSVWNFNYANCRLIVPPGTKELYQEAPVWKKFGANIEEVATIKISSPDSIFLGSYGNELELTDTVEVLSNSDWTVAIPANVKWMTLDTVAGSNFTVTGNHRDSIYTLRGNGNGRFTVRVLPNSGAPEREADITISKEILTSSVHVSQDWNVVEVEGIRYARNNPNIYSDTYIGVSSKDGGYSGNIVVPPTMEYKGITYNVESIHANAFKDCSELDSVTISYGVKYIEGEAFLGCSNLTSVTIPNSVTSMGFAVFNSCAKLTSITIPNSVVNLDQSLFTGCSGLTGVTLLASVTELPFATFAHCSALTFLEVGWNTPVAAGDAFAWNAGFTHAFSSNYRNAALIVPQGSKALYAAADVWKDFKVIIEKGELSVSPGNLFFGVNEFLTDTVKVIADVAHGGVWTVSVPEDIDWLELSRESGYAIADTFVVTAKPNEGAEREAEITVTNGDAVVTITVTQQVKPLITVSGESLHFAHSPTDSQPITITSNVAWTVQVDVAPGDETDWLSVDPPSGVGDEVLTVAAKVNTGEERKGTITVSSAIGYSVIPVTQNAFPYLNVSTESLSFKDNDPEAKTVAVTSKIAWEVTINPEDADWLTLTFNSPTGAGSGDFTVRALPNAGVEREADIIVAPAAAVAGIEPKTIHVRQDATASGVNMNPGSLSFGADESTSKPVSVTTEGRYAVSTNETWLTLDPEAPEGDGYGTFHVAAAENTGQERIGRIAVENEDTSVIYYVKQSAAPYLRLSADTLSFGANSSLTQGVIVTSNATWDIASSVSWMTLSAESGNGNGSFYAAAETNTGGERKGIITIKSSGKSYTIHVEQEATQALRFKDGDLYFYTPDRHGTTVEVAGAEEGGYSGAITIPPTATDPESKKTYDVTGIGDRAFYNSASLRSVTIPNSVVDIGDRAFTYCGNLVSVEIPNSVERIGEWAFSACTNLASVYIPRSVIQIMNGAFNGCSKLASISIPNTVAELACMAFYDCINLTAMHVYWDTPPKLPNINPDFSDYTHCTLYVPAGMKRAYQYAWYWANFVDIIERSTTGTDKVTTESAITVRAEVGRLYVDSPAAETIYVYSFTGKLLHVATKAPGKAEFDLSTREKLIIVRGSSGWGRKLIVNH